MKRIVILTTIVLLATMAMMTSGQSAKQQPRKRHMPRKTLMIKRPASLKAGDKIAIISPASTPGDDNPDKAAATLRAWGF